MNEQLGSNMRETLSALMDDEASELELHRIMRDVSSDESLTATWFRYHLAGSAIRKDLPADFVDSSTELRAAINMALVNEPVPKKQGQWFQVVGRMAVVASVAMVAIFGVQQYQAINTTTSVPLVAKSQVVEAKAAGGEYSGPQFQLPSGFEIPQATARTASTGSFNNSFSRVGRVEPQRNADKYETDRQIQLYMHRLTTQQGGHGYPHSGQILLPVGRIYQQVESSNLAN